MKPLVAVNFSCVKNKTADVLFTGNRPWIWPVKKFGQPKWQVQASEICGLICEVLHESEISCILLIYTSEVREKQSSMKLSYFLLSITTGKLAGHVKQNLY